MKRRLIFFLLVIPIGVLAQTYKIRIGGAAGAEFEIGKIPPGISFNQNIISIEIKKDTADVPPTIATLKIDDQLFQFLTDGQYYLFSFSKDIRNSKLSVINAKLGVKSFELPKIESLGSSKEDTIPVVIIPEMTINQFITDGLFKDQIQDIEGVGIKLFKSSANESQSSQFMGSKYIHLFYDQNGNSLLHSVPIGIEKANYIVHIIYLAPEDKLLLIDYKVIQSPADLGESPNIHSDSGLSDIIHLESLNLKKDRVNDTIKLVWKHTETALTPSTNDIKFDIVKSSLQVKKDDYGLNNEVVATKEIKIKKVYHGSLDVGVLMSDLENPTYTMCNSDIDPAQMVVKKTNTGSRILASAMYTFYLSPVILFEKVIWPDKVQSYNMSSRSFVDDHKIYERIYPTVGIGLNNRLLDNVYIGGKWEFIRGGSLFVGYHFGKVNVLNVDPGFEFGKTYMTTSSFDLKKDTKYKGSYCVGLNLDIRIITNLFQTTTANK